MLMLSGSTDVANAAVSSVTFPNQTADETTGDSRTAGPMYAGLFLTGLTAAATFIAITQLDPQTSMADFSAIGRIHEPDQLTPSVLTLHEAAISEMIDYLSVEPGWDGHGSLAPFRAAVEDSIAFLRALPANFPAPEPSLSADGSVSWFWEDDDTSITVNFSGDGHFAYFGKNSLTSQVARGSNLFDGRSIPNDLLRIIELV